MDRIFEECYKKLLKDPRFSYMGKDEVYKKGFLDARDSIINILKEYMDVEFSL